MSATTGVVRVGGKMTFTRDDVVELLAALHAAGSLNLEDGGMDNETREQAISNLQWGYYVEYLGVLPEGDDDSVWENDPEELLFMARGSEIHADLIDAGHEIKAKQVKFAADFGRKVGYPAKLRLFATRLRTAGTQKGVYFPSDGDVQVHYDDEGESGRGCVMSVATVEKPIVDFAQLRTLLSIAQGMDEAKDDPELARACLIRLRDRLEELLAEGDDA